jgi:5-methyltetrahydropteroyltriglutamate--homocysteine methyltransferase
VLESLPGKTILVGVLDLSTPEVESAETVAGRVRRVLPHVDVERVVLAPDCGMKYLPRDAAAGKLRSMVAAARTLRSEHAGATA